MLNIFVDSIELQCGHTLFNVVMPEEQFHDLQEGTLFWCPTCGESEIVEVSENYQYTTEEVKGEN